MDGVNLHPHGSKEGCAEEQEADDELPGGNGGIAEVLFIEQHDCGGSKQTDNSGTQAHEHALHGSRLHVAHEHLTDENHEDERWQHQ